MADALPLRKPAGRRPIEPGAYAVVRGEEPRVFLAEDAAVMARVLGVELVAGTPASAFASPEECDAARAALLDERWVDAVLIWMRATGEIVDVYEGYVPVWSGDELDHATAALELRCGALFHDVGHARIA